MAKSFKYMVTVIETNEIAGENFACEVPIFTSKTLFGASEWAEKKWGGRPPLGAQIRCKNDGTVYRLPRKES